MAQDLSEMLQQVMGNPEVAKILANPGLAQALANPTFAAMVQNLRQQMGNGEGTAPDMAVLMEKLPGMLSLLSGNMGTETSANVAASVAANETDEEKKETGMEKEKAETTVLPGQMLFRPEARDKRNKLLSALKPYLSPARCTMIDRAMSAMQLGELLGTMGMGATQQGEGD